jgi:glycosyltransferase involved in cell wall biosynthesis
MKIAIIAPTYLPARRANTIQVMKMAHALVQAGHALQLAVPDSYDEPKPAWEELAHFYGLEQQFPITWLPAHPRLRRYDYGWRAVQWARGWGAQLIYTRLPQAAALASWLGSRVVFEIHDLPQGTMGPLFLRLFLGGRGASRLVVISQMLLDDLKDRFRVTAGGQFALVVPDAVDLGRYHDLPEPNEARLKLLELGQVDLEPGRFTAGYTGHLYPGRGQEMILELAGRLPEIIFLVVGGDPGEVSRLRGAANSRRLENLVLTGFVPNSDLPLYQAACEVLLMPYQQVVAASSGGDISRYLSPMKMFEYLACGRAILSSDLPVLGEVLSPQNAVLLPADDADAWVDALKTLRQDPQRRAQLGEQARCTAQDHSWINRAATIFEGLQA